MALSFRRSREPAPDSVSPGVIDSHVQHALKRARDHRQTGALRLEDRVTGAAARVFLFQGHPYAVDIDGFSPNIGARLVAAGALTREQADQVGSGPRAGQAAVSHGWITAEQLGAVHQELMLASFGAAVVVGRPRLDFEENAVTDMICTVPVAVDPLMESVPVRAARMEATWSTLVTSGSPSSAVFLETGVPRPQALDRAEFGALLLALSPGISLDEAAWRAGFTRAEAVHLAGILVAAHVVALSEGHVEAASDRLLVPEQFGHLQIEQLAPVASPESVAAEIAVDGGWGDDLPRAELRQLQSALEAAIEEERQVTVRVAELRARIQQLTEDTGKVDTP